MGLNYLSNNDFFPFLHSSANHHLYQDYFAQLDLILTPTKSNARNKPAIMSFILNLFSSHDEPSSPTSPTTTTTPVSPSTTSTDKQNAAALKALIKLHKQALRAEYSRFVLDYKLALDHAAQEHKRARKQAEVDLQRRAEEAVRRRMEVIAESEEVLRADDKTRKMFMEFQRSLLGDALPVGAATSGVSGFAGLDVGTVGEGGRREGEELMMMQGLGTVEIEGFLVQDTYLSPPFSASDGVDIIQEAQPVRTNGKLTFKV
ncbi:hypothetical protein EC991_005908 [Linnemannia zychae]|nr:hypothetical protein EC991_005908 [Linnemannia zychae]